MSHLPSDHSLEAVNYTAPPDAIRAALARILASEEFAGSAQLSRFLRHIVENSIPGRVSVLKESVIGVAVFNRGSGYDPKADPIVRVEARRLRARLDAYYAKNGARETVRISLPKGGYIPSFEMIPAPEREAGSGREGTQPASAPVPARGPALLSRWPVVAALLSCAVLIIPGVTVYRAGRPEHLVNRFWSSLLQADRPALLIPADSSLVVLENLSHQSVSLPEYISGEYRDRLIASTPSDHFLVSIFGTRRYTSIADLEFGIRLAHRPEAARSGIVTRYARDVRVEDLKGRNVILLGARQSNPWVGLFEKNATFRLDDDERTAGLRIVNLAPQNGEPAVIERSPAEMAKEIYAIITYHHNRNGSGIALLVAGMSVAGTEAAADFVLDDQRLGPWLRKAEGDGGIRDFDILLRGRNLDGTAPMAEVVSFHVTPVVSPSSRRALSGGMSGIRPGSPDEKMAPQARPAPSAPDQTARHMPDGR